MIDPGWCYWLGVRPDGDRPHAHFYLKLGAGLDWVATAAHDSRLAYRVHEPQCENRLLALIRNFFESIHAALSDPANFFDSKRLYSQ